MYMYTEFFLYLIRVKERRRKNSFAQDFDSLTVSNVAREIRPLSWDLIYTCVYDAEKCTDDATYSNAEKCRCFLRKCVLMYTSTYIMAL